MLRTTCAIHDHGLRCAQKRPRGAGPSSWCHPFQHRCSPCPQLSPPTPWITRPWHEFILCTRIYGTFCRRHFGRMIHHQPEGMEDENNSQFDQTLALYQRYFGPPPAAYWLPGADCGACRSANS